MTTFDVREPRTGEVIETLTSAPAFEVSNAVARAQGAQSAWAKLPAPQRAAALREAATRLESSAAEIAGVQAMESGKSLADSTAEVAAAIEIWHHFADEIERGYGIRQLEGSDFVSRRPYGVAAVIVPWNYPILIGFRFIPGVLSVGNTVLWKPSEKTPLSAIAAMAAIGDALPPGVLQLLVGDGSTGQYLVDDARVALVAFTGSTATGRSVARAGAEHLRTNLLELGGKDAVIVDASANIDAAADLVATGALTNTGQICTSFERIFVVESLAGAFIDALADRVSSAWRTADIGGNVAPLIDEGQRAIVTRQVESALATGARAISGGKPLESPGYYYPPTILVGVDPSMDIMTKETFGPVIPVATAPDLDRALRMADDTEYGLAATYIGDESNVPRVLAGLDVGTLWVNCWHEYRAGALHQPGRTSGVGAIGWRGHEFLDAVSQPTFVSFGD